MRAFSSSINEIECEFPDSLEDIDLFENFLTHLPKLPPNLKKIDIQLNKLQKLFDGGESLTEVNIKGNHSLKMEQIYEYEKKISPCTLLYDIRETREPQSDNDFTYRNLDELMNLSRLKVKKFSDKQDIPSFMRCTDDNPHFIRNKKMVIL